MARRTRSRRWRPGSCRSCPDRSDSAPRPAGRHLRCATDGRPGRHPNPESTKGSDMIRLVTFMRRKPGLELDEFQERLRTEYGPLVASYQTPLGIRRYTQTHRMADIPAQVSGDPR